MGRKEKEMTDSGLVNSRDSNHTVAIPTRQMYISEKASKTQSASIASKRPRPTSWQPAGLSGSGIMSIVFKKPEPTV